jgi:membrane-bound ClpP family serine protease
MTALAVALMVTGALLLVAEAHLASYGLLGVAGVLALGAGGLLAISEAGGSVVLGLAIFLPIAIGLVALMVIAGRKSLALRRRRRSATCWSRASCGVRATRGPMTSSARASTS